MNTTTRTGKAVQRLSDAQLREQLLERLDAAMHLWATRKREPAEIVERRLDELRDAWAAARMALGDELRIEPPAIRQANVPASPRSTRPARQRSGDIHRTRAARASKAPDDQAREKYIVRRYAQLIRRGRTRSEALSQIATDIRNGRYLPDWRFNFDRAPPYADTYSAKSVARVLKKYAPR